MVRLTSLIQKKVTPLLQRYVCGSDKVTDDEVIRHFHELFYNRVHSTWNDTYWMGAKILKNPFDLWIYQEIIFATKPDVIVECGTRHGGSALCLAHLCDLLGHGRIVSVDIEPDALRPTHPRITYLIGSSLSSDILKEVERATDGQRSMVSLDSDHRQAHVLSEMRAYGPFVSLGCYMIVEDTNLNGHPVLPEFGPGPHEAVEQFLRETRDFEDDPRCEKFLFTFHPRGFLRRVGQHSAS